MELKDFKTQYCGDWIESSTEKYKYINTFIGNSLKPMTVISNFEENKYSLYYCIKGFKTGFIFRIKKEKIKYITIGTDYKYGLNSIYRDKIVITVICEKNLEEDTIHQFYPEDVNKEICIKYNL